MDAASVWSNYDSNWLLAVASDRFRQRVSCTPGVGEASDGLDLPCRSCCRIRDRADRFANVAGEPIPVLFPVARQV